MALIDALLAFAVALLIGSIAIHIAAQLIVGRASFGNAVFTALIGALVWGVVAFLLGWIPVFGPLLALVAWVAVINARYPGGWLNAITIGVIAWGAAVIVIYLLTLAGIGSLAALGVPGA